MDNCACATCPECKGSKIIVVAAQGSPEWDVAPCPWCGGLGFLPNRLYELDSVEWFFGGGQ